MDKDEIADKARKMVEEERKIAAYRAQVEAEVEENKQALIGGLPDVDVDEFVKHMPPAKGRSSYLVPAGHTPRDPKWFTKSVHLVAEAFADMSVADVGVILGANRVESVGNPLGVLSLALRSSRDHRKTKVTTYLGMLREQPYDKIADLLDHLEIAEADPGRPTSPAPSALGDAGNEAPAVVGTDQLPASRGLFEGAIFNDSKIVIAQGDEIHQTGFSQVNITNDLEQIAEFVQALSKALTNPGDGVPPEQVEILREQVETLTAEVEKGASADKSVIRRSVGLLRDFGVSFSASGLWEKVGPELTALVGLVPWL